MDAVIFTCCDIFTGIRTVVVNQWMDLYIYDPKASICLRQVVNQIDPYYYNKLENTIWI